MRIGDLRVCMKKWSAGRLNLRGFVIEFLHSSLIFEVLALLVLVPLMLALVRDVVSSPTAFVQRDKQASALISESDIDLRVHHLCKYQE
jgi:hypothetical protein